MKIVILWHSILTRCAKEVFYTTYVGWRLFVWSIHARQWCRFQCDHMRTEHILLYLCGLTTLFGVL